MPKRIIALIIFCACGLAYHLTASNYVTSPIWEKPIEHKIFSDPLANKGIFYFWCGNKGKNFYKLVGINDDGDKVAETMALPSMPFDPTVVGDKIVMADHSRMLRAFDTPSLQIAWEAAANEPFDKSPIKCGNSKVLQASGNYIFCFDVKNGKQLWDIAFLEPVKNYGCNKVIIGIHGYKDVAKPLWKCNAYDVEDGLELWKLEEPVSSYNPVFVKNCCVLTTAEGEALVIDQLSGKILSRSGVKGLIAIKGLEDFVLLANNDYTNLVCLSLTTGKSWTTSLKRDFTGAVQFGSRIVVTDKVDMRCFEAETGKLLWEEKLGDIYASYPHRSGLFVTYKEFFSARETYGACIDPNSGEKLWVSQDTSIFKKIHAVDDGDLVFNFNGRIALMPIPTFKNSIGTGIMDIKMPDPMEKVNKAFEQKALENSSTPVNNTKTNKNKLPEIKTISDEEAGW